MYHHSLLSLGLSHLVSWQKHANLDCLRHVMEAASDLVGEGEDSVHDDKERGGDDPEELLEHAEVGLAVPDQATVSVEDQEGAESVAEVHDNEEEMAGEVLGLDEDSTDGNTVGGGGVQEEQEGQAETAHWSQDTWEI